MDINISRLNLLEKDIEDWLYANPDQIIPNQFDIKSLAWVGRQYVLPSGIADLIGITDNGYIVVVEVKNVEINKAALTQVARYAYDVTWIAARFKDYKKEPINDKPVIIKMVIGPSIDRQTLLEAHALDTEIVTFGVTFSIELYSTDEDVEEQVDERREAGGRLAFQPEWDSLGTRYDNWRTTPEIEAWRKAQADAKKEYQAEDSGNDDPDEYDELMDAITGNDEEGEESNG